MSTLYAQEKQLRCAVLEQAISDFVRGGPDEAVSVARAEVCKERLAITWIFGDDQKHSFSFESICDLVDVDPGELRALLIERLLEQEYDR